MKKMKRWAPVLMTASIVALSGWLRHSTAFAESEEVKAEPKAVLSVSNEEGIKLAPEAIQTLSLKSAPVVTNTAGALTVPLSSLIYHQDEIGIYRRRSDWFKLVEVKVIKKTHGEATVRAEGIESSDQVVVQGAPLLRVADLQAHGGPTDTD